ncbi:MAG TPA: tRNA (adenosine(37)-N6)-dimethylallyltransferase MiaA [Tenuifilaceae bacterium]|nr:tRNA (adenosine(37)-N6)-dimethylallyltransferase MiaA [Tenuifilaceae bacterium]
MEIPNPKGYNLITILGPTAGGKTAVAANLAFAIGGEVISGDSRQVYRGMDLGTGKDLHDYTVNGKQVPYHLIDIVDAGYQLNVYEYQQHFVEAFNDISGRGAFPILCGGSGMYIEAAIKGYKLIAVPENPELRGKLASLEMHELEEMLKSYKQLHNQTDTVNRKRLVRAIEIEEYYARVGEGEHSYPRLQNIIFGIAFPRHQQRERITQRLKQRLDEGMVDEVKSLLDKGIKPPELIYYGLEYKWITRFLMGEIGYHEMFTGLNTAIHQFGKRQMTWFRKMERSGIPIHWIDGNIPLEQKIEAILTLIGK